MTSTIYDYLIDPKLWISFAALVVSILSSRKSARALKISENQEQRRQPQLKIYLADGYRRLAPNRQLFCFGVSIGNPTDINNSIMRAELEIEYIVGDGITTVCRIQHNQALGEREDGTASPFSLPTRIDAHQTVSGWFLFSLENDVIRKGTVDGHSLILEDTHGIATSSGPIMVREWIVDEAQNN